MCRLFSILSFMNSLFIDYVAFWLVGVRNTKKVRAALVKLFIEINVVKIGNITSKEKNSVLNCSTIAYSYVTILSHVF